MTRSPRVVGRISFVLAAGLACSVDATVADDVGVGTTTAPVGTDGSSSSSAGDPGDDTSTPATTSVDSSSDESADDGGDGPKLDVASGETGTTLDECEDDAPDLIHVIDTAREIWTFDPIAVEFQLLTTVVCPEVDQISGFAIDRNSRITLFSYEPSLPMPGGVQTTRLSQMNPGDANCDVLFEGGLAEGDVQSVDCADISLVAGGADDPGHEILYASRCTGGGFTIATDAGSIWRTDLADAEPVFDLLAENDYTSVPLAGTGDGRLFGISGDQGTPGSTVILEFDPSAGGIIGTTSVPEIEIGDGGSYLALSFYGGDLYTFGHTGKETLVYRYDWDDDDGNGEPDIEQVTPLDDVPFPAGIFAAASPTCIPLGPAG